MDYYLTLLVKWIYEEVKKALLYQILVFTLLEKHKQIIHQQ